MFELWVGNPETATLEYLGEVKDVRTSWTPDAYWILVVCALAYAYEFGN